jgi:hypothetical protein
MTQGANVLRMLRPNGGWAMNGDDYEGIQFLECEPFTKAEFDAALKKVDAWQAEKDATKAATKAALLERLGITADEAKLLLE